MDEYINQFFDEFDIDPTTMDDTDLNLSARHLVEAFFRLSPEEQLTHMQKWVYLRLFRAARRLIEINMERYGHTLTEAAGHLTKAEIKRHADIQEQLTLLEESGC